MQGSNPGSHKAALLWRGRPPFGKNQSTSRRLGVSAAWLNKAAAAPHLPPARNERLSSHIPLTTPSLDCLRPAEGGTALPWLGCVPEARGRGVSEAMWKSAFIPLSTQTHNTHTPTPLLGEGKKANSLHFNHASPRREPLHRAGRTLAAPFVGTTNYRTKFSTVEVLTGPALSYHPIQNSPYHPLFRGGQGGEGQVCARKNSSFYESLEVPPLVGLLCPATKLSGASRHQAGMLSTTREVY